MSIRVRQITDFHLNYDSLVSMGILPQFTVSHSTKRYPMWVYKELKPILGNNTFSCFGVFIEAVIKAMLTETNWKDRVYPLFTSTSGVHLPKETVHKSFGLYGSIKKMLDSRDWSRVLFDQEFTITPLSGHPDIVIGTEILDVKCTSNFKNSTGKGLLQILAYAALARANGQKVTHIGFVFPLQGEIVKYDITNWNSSEAYLKVLLQKADQLTMDPITRMIWAENICKPVGYTIHKEGTLENSFNKYLSSGRDKPIQIFLKGNQAVNADIPESDVLGSASVICNFGLSVYIHSPYTINLSKPWSKKFPDDKTWGVDLLKGNLKVGVQIGAKGVVVHVGKSAFKDGLERQYNNIIDCLTFATNECPLLLETPVGAGTELLADLESFKTFYYRVNQPNFKVCIDTCHVHCAGYDPWEYIKDWDPKAVGLIHFNDSKKPLGCRADGHARCGTGKILLDSLQKVSDWAVKHGVDMVHE